MYIYSKLRCSFIWIQDMGHVRLIPEHYRPTIPKGRCSEGLYSEGLLGLGLVGGEDLALQLG